MNSNKLKYKINTGINIIKKEITKWFLKNTTLKFEKDKTIQLEKTDHILLLLLISAILSLIIIIFSNNIIKYNFDYDFQQAIIIIFSLIASLMWGISIFSNKIHEYHLFPTIIFIIIFQRITNIYALIISTIILILVYIFVQFEKWKKPSNWLVFTILVMSVTFLSGTLIIDATYGYKPLSLKSNDNISNNSYGILECDVSSDPFLNRIYINSNVICKPDKPFNITYSKVTFIFHNGTKQEINILNFTAPPNLSRIAFELDVITPENKSRKLTTANYHTFYTYDEFVERNEKFVTYFMALIGIIMFSIPLMMLNFKNLNENKK